jgi:hypothetical protein
LQVSTSDTTLTPALGSAARIVRLLREIRKNQNTTNFPRIVGIASIITVTAGHRITGWLDLEMPAYQQRRRYRTLRDLVLRIRVFEFHPIGGFRDSAFIDIGKLVT